jgi:hypothetical protein
LIAVAMPQIYDYRDRCQSILPAAGFSDTEFVSWLSADVNMAEERQLCPLGSAEPGMIRTVSHGNFAA